VPAGSLHEQERRFDIRVLQPPAEPTAAAIGDSFVLTERGLSVPMRGVVTLSEGEGPTSVRRQDRKRAILRGMPFSLPAAVGFIALGGIGVLNGVIIATEVRRRLSLGEDLDTAIVDGTTQVVRAVLTTAAVAALGFLPMATASSAGAEVQRPLATVVVIGMFVGTALTLLVLPGVLRIALGSYRPRPEVEEEEQELPEPHAGHGMA